MCLKVIMEGDRNDSLSMGFSGRIPPHIRVAVRIRIEYSDYTSNVTRSAHLLECSGNVWTNVKHLWSAEESTYATLANLIQNSISNPKSTETPYIVISTQAFLCKSPNSCHFAVQRPYNTSAIYLIAETSSMWTNSLERRKCIAHYNSPTGKVCHALYLTHRLSMSWIFLGLKSARSSKLHSYIFCRVYFVVYQSYGKYR